ncbi:MAG: peptide chain release factor N(5)-glutamine methyltransferase [Leadbetterella sp.]
MKAKVFYADFLKKITGFEIEEAREIVFWIFQKCYGLSKTDILLDPEIDPTKIPADWIEKLNRHVPVQYILNEAEFCGMKFYVDYGVLIPRPETEELVTQVAYWNPKRILDLGTGSGCIPIYLAKILPNSTVLAVDVSEDALRIATQNADNHKVNVKFIKKDILNFDIAIEEKMDCIVSNPPYVKISEAKEMLPHVLKHEPHLALFVEDEDPLLFYKAIAQIGQNYLKNGGKIALEINAALGNETAQVFVNQGYSDVEIRKDFFGKDRFIFAVWN